MSPIRLGNGFWIVQNSDQIIDAAFTQMCHSSPIKNGRDEDHKKQQFKRYTILAYRTPQVFPQMVHISFRDNMRIIIEGTALPNQYLLGCGQQGARPNISNIDISLDLIANAVIYDCNPNHEIQKFTTWGFLHLTHRKVVIDTLTALNYSNEELSELPNDTLEKLMFVEGHAGVLIGTPCVTGRETMFQNVAVALNPMLRESFNDFPRLIDRFGNELRRIQETSSEFIVENKNGYVYRIRAESREQSVSWKPESRPSKEPSYFSSYGNRVHEIQRDVRDGQTDLFGIS